MNDQERIGKLREALAGAIGAIQALADIARSNGNPVTAAKAIELATGYLETLKETQTAAA